MALSHVDEKGSAKMVDVSEKTETRRVATAEGQITMGSEAFQAAKDNSSSKGDVLSAARLAGIMAAKKTSELIPLCHPLPISSVSVDFELDEAGNAIKVKASATTVAKTGIEMEVLTAVSVALLTVYDMLKAIDKAMEIGPVRLIFKSGGKSGEYNAS